MKTFIASVTILIALSIGGGAASDHVAPPAAQEDEVATVDPTVAWALERFERAGLALPDLTVEFSDTRAACGGNTAVAVHGLDIPGIVVCASEEATTSVVHRTLLHEMAHIWAKANLDASTRESFLVLRGLRSWDDADRWQDRGSEQAAEIITWALMDRELLMATLTDHSAESLASGYEMLTGDPVPPR